VTALIRAEFLKLRTTQVWFWLLVASVALTVLGVVGPIASSNNADLSDHVRDVFVSANVAYIAVFVLGILAVTTEFRYQTITPTVLATPSRWSVVTAKLIAYAVVGAGYAIVCIGIEVAIAAPWLAGRNLHVAYGDETGALLAVFGVVSLMGLVGMGLGALMRNQVVAVSVGVIVVVFLENLIALIPGVRRIYPFLPGGAINAVITARRGDRRFASIHLLPIWGGAVALVVWALAMSLLGAGFTMNRDIT
jgi:hypothetical protein